MDSRNVYDRVCGEGRQLAVLVSIYARARAVYECTLSRFVLGGGDVQHTELGSTLYGCARAACVLKVVFVESFCA